MKFTTDDIQHIANLARLKLSAAELFMYGKQLSLITSYIDQLQEVVSVAAPIDYSLHNVWRQDEVREWSTGENEQALSQGEREGGLLKVKRVL
jgi:aspartyl-tRNA(Asn)/glutamyl-tRNA(Gln) amidotransferase subunit C